MKTTKHNLLTAQDVEHITKLANLSLTDKELTKFQKQLSVVLSYFRKLKETKTEKVEATNWSTKLSNAFREDIITPSLTQEEVLSNAKETHNGYFKVKAIFEE